MSNKTNYDYLIVGAGFSGIVCAQQLAEMGYKILIIDKRSHIGGNAFDKLDQHGVLIHPYGPHIFHTNSKKVFDYLSEFTEWSFYEHRVLAENEGKLYPIPINRTTINSIYGLNLSEAGVEAFLEKNRIVKKGLKTSEDVVLNSVGPDLCDRFFRGYTKKQWGLDLSDLSAGVAARIPTRCNDDDRYFTDQYQFMPKNGYTKMFEKMLASDNIDILLNSDFNIVKGEVIWDKMIYSGPVDEYFKYCFGKLPYRSLHFEHQHFSGEKAYQKSATINFPNDYDYTRITEFKYITGQKVKGTSIVTEYPTADGDPYYPIPRPENNKLFQKYKIMAENEKDVTFLGRLAQYKYYNMDQVVAAALKFTGGIDANK